MTDAHCHVSCGEADVREFLIGRDFLGVHPWDAARTDETALASMFAELERNPAIGVGEIGLDRLRERTISEQMRRVFETQLQWALDHRRPLVLHGAKCWGQVLAAVKSRAGGTIPPFLCHGFSRSDGLIPDIVALGGYVSVGPAVLNDHAVNYRELVKKLPPDRLLVETDRTAENAATSPSVRDVLAKTAELRGLSFAALENQTDANADRFRSPPG